jgi:hypothetical protein
VNGGGPPAEKSDPKKPHSATTTLQVSSIAWLLLRWGAALCTVQPEDAHSQDVPHQLHEEDSASSTAEPITMELRWGAPPPDHVAAGEQGGGRC